MLSPSTLSVVLVFVVDLLPATFLVERLDFFFDTFFRDVEVVLVSTLETVDASDSLLDVDSDVALELDRHLDLSAVSPGSLLVVDGLRCEVGFFVWRSLLSAMLPSTRSLAVTVALSAESWPGLGLDR